MIKRKNKFNFTRVLFLHPDGNFRIFYINKTLNMCGGLCYGKDFKNKKIIKINKYGGAQDIIDDL